MKNTAEKDRTCQCRDEEKPEGSEIQDEIQDILEEIEIEDLAVDGICGVY